MEEEIVPSIQKTGAEQIQLAPNTYSLRVEERALRSHRMRFVTGCNKRISISSIL